MPKDDTPEFDFSGFPALWPDGHDGSSAITADNLIKARQEALSGITESHDGHMREWFQLDKFGDLLAYDPQIAKQETSAAFQMFGKDHDLYAMVEQDLYALQGEPIRKRTTRRAAHDRMDQLGLSQRQPVASTSKTILPKKAPRKSGTTKVRATQAAEPEPAEPSPKYAKPKGKGKAPARGNGRGRSRTSSALEAEEDASMDVDTLEDTEEDDTAGDEVLHSKIEHPAPPAKPKPKKQAPAKKPVKRKPTISLDISPFEAPLKKIRLDLPDGTERPEPPVPQNHYQVLPEAEFDGSIEAYLSSYVSIEDITGHDERPREFTNRIITEAKTFDRITAFKNEGRLGSLNPDKRYRDKERLRSKDGDHQDHLLEHTRDFSKRLADERRSHVAHGKKVAKMIQGYFEELEGREERKQEEEKKRMKGVAKWVAKEVMKKWSLAADIVRAKYIAEEEAKAEKEGRKRLNAILDESHKFLKSRREDLVGSGSEADSFSDHTIEEEDDAESNEEAEEMDDTRDSMSREPSSAAQTRDVSMSREPSTIAGDGDGDFASADEAERLDEDDALAREMENEEEQELRQIKAEESDEDAGLAKDAEMPIEELLKKYGYRASPPAPEASPSQSREASEAIPEVDVNTAANETEAGEQQGEAVQEPSKQEAKPNGVHSQLKTNQDVEFTDDEEAAAMQENEDIDLDAAMDSDEAHSEDDDAEMKALKEDADKPLDDEFLAEYLRARQAEEEAKAATADEDAQSTTTSPDAGEESVAQPSEAVDEEQADEDVKEDEDDDPKLEEGDPEEDEEDAEPERIKVVVPFLLRGNLRPYQKGGLDWLASLYQNGLNGILADEMGLGKTIQTISLLAWLACERGVWGPHLIIVPTSVMLNWEMEFKKFLPGFKILTYYGSVKERQAKRKGWNTPNQFHVCITSYQIALSDQHIFRRKMWHYMILDEAHHIKNFRSQRWQTLLTFHSTRRLLLTGTPLQNNLMELWSLLYFLMPGGLKNGPFANHQEFQEWFSNPMDRAVENNGPLDAETRATVGRLHTILRPYLLRRLKAEVEKEMPGKYEHVIPVKLSKRQRYLYDEFMSRAATKDSLASGNFMSIVNCLMQLRKVCNHPDLFEVREVRTSLALDKSVAEDFGIQDFLVRKHLLRNFEDTELLEYFNLEPSNSLHAAVARCHLSGTQALRDKLMNELGPEPPERPLTIRTSKGWIAYLKRQRYVAAKNNIDQISAINARRTVQQPVYPAELVDSMRLPPLTDNTQANQNLIQSTAQRADGMSETISRFAFATPSVKARGIDELVLPSELEDLRERDELFEPFHLASTKLAIAFPDASLIQYDCGKLQVLADLLRQFQTNGQRVLIFTQMTKVLDILEIFLSWLGHRYLRLDGSTKVEDRQVLTERFNRDERIMAFISSTRAGGLGINLTGASCVVFYDSDWNPAMDRQCQDRCHRIGQTRDVHIYRLVCANTIEENMLKKANQKRRLEGVVISEGDFTTEYFNKTDWRDMLDDDSTQVRRASPAPADDSEAVEQRRHFDKEMRAALMEAEDEVDQQAAEEAEGELVLDNEDFEDEGGMADAPEQKEGEEGDELDGTLDAWMLEYLDRDENEDLFEFL